jgi:hypothetical protein
MEKPVAEEKLVDETIPMAAHFERVDASDPGAVLERRRRSAAHLISQGFPLAEVDALYGDLGGSDGASVSLLDRIDALSRYGAGWNGRSAAAPNRASLSDARLFAVLPVAWAAKPDASLHANGNVVFDFEGDGLFASLQFYGKGAVAAYVSLRGTEWDADVAFDGRSLPPELLGRVAAAAGGRRSMRAVDLADAQMAAIMDATPEGEGHELDDLPDEGRPPAR